MKGFAITLDALMAVSFLLFAILLVAGQSQPPRSAGSIYLKQLTMDTVTVMEKTNMLDPALSGNDTSVRQIIEATPKLACMYVSIANVSGDVVYGIVKSDCDEKSGLDIQVTTRPVLYHGGVYVLKSESWFRKEPG